MAYASTIRHRADLVVNITDAVSGRAPGKPLRLYADGKELRFRMPGTGMALLTDTGRHDFTLTAEMIGYVPVDVEVRYSELDVHLPQIDVALSPLDEEGG
jgi:hypothetical protein